MTDQDAAYVDLERRSRAGDKQAEVEAQAIVDAAAKAAGYNIGPVWQGSDHDPKNTITSRVRGIVGYFTPNKSHAEAYGEARPYYLKISNLLNVMTCWNGPDRAYTLDEWKDILEDYGIHDVKLDSSLEDEADDDRGGGRFDFWELIDPPGKEAHDSNLLDLIKSAGYDGILQPEGCWDITPDKIYIPFKMTQFKYAKPFVYRDDGSLIPLSQRFKSSSADIRESVDIATLVEAETRRLDIASLKVRDELSPDFWTGTSLILSAYRKMLRIGNFFFESLDLGEDIRYEDIVFTGSLAGYNWSRYSDVDIHIVLDYTKVNEDEELVGELLRAKTANWESKHQIEIEDYPVQLFVERAGEGRHANGSYSLTRGEWIDTPEKVDTQIAKKSISRKAHKIIKEIDTVEQMLESQDYRKALETARNIKSHIRRMRQAGLDSGGELSTENLVFKVLRRGNEIERLSNLVVKAYDTLMLSEEPDDQSQTAAE